MRRIVSFGTGVIFRTSGGRRKKSRIAAVGAALAVTLAGTSLAGVPAASASPGETVIVTATGLLSPVTAVLTVGGTIVTQFHLINGVEAVIPAILEPVLAALPGITVTPDLSVSVQSTTESTGPHTPSDDFLSETGAGLLAAQGNTGQGVTVAVVDTGIDKRPDFSGRLAGGVDLTGGNDPFQDSYGHGTFVAGLIAGNGASSNGQYSGEAPGARLVSIKVAGASGSSHLSTLILGLQWAVDHRASYGINVLNLSLGYQSSQSTVTNPLDQAVERVWNAGITVVASAGNAGPFNGTILSPGDDPMVITVGALDDMATPSPLDDEMTDFSSAGPTSVDGWAKPDLVASGRSVVSLAAPGSTIYNSNPSARIGTANFVGSGTSFSSAITSGAAALVLAANPGLTPNEVKARLLGTTTPRSGRQPLRRRPRGPRRLRGGHRGSDEPEPVGHRPARCRAGRHDWAVAQRAGRHLEREPVVRDHLESGAGRRGKLGRLGVGRRGLERLDLDQPGLERRRLGRGGVERRRLGQPGLERRRLGRFGLERSGLERSGLGRRGLEQLRMAVTSPAVSSPAASRAVATTKIPRVTRAIIAASVAGGVATLGVAGWRHSGVAQASGIQWIVAAAMGLLALASWLWPVVVYREGESEAFNTDDTFFVILALLVPPLLTLATLALAFVVAQAARRRLFVKSAFNTGQVLTAAGLGLAASRALAPPSASLSAAEVAALLLGVGVYFAVNSCLIAGGRHPDGHDVA